MRPTRSQMLSRTAGTPGTGTGSAGWPLSVLPEIIGESANALSSEFRAGCPDVPWKDVIGLRIVLAHHYHRVDPNQVWVIATSEVPVLAEHLRGF